MPSKKELALLLLNSGNEENQEIAKKVLEELDKQQTQKTKTNVVFPQKTNQRKRIYYYYEKEIYERYNLRKTIKKTQKTTIEISSTLGKEDKIIKNAEWLSDKDEEEEDKRMIEEDEEDELEARKKLKQQTDTLVANMSDYQGIIDNDDKSENEEESDEYEPNEEEENIDETDEETDEEEIKDEIEHLENIKREAQEFEKEMDKKERIRKWKLMSLVDKLRDVTWKDVKEKLPHQTLFAFCHMGETYRAKWDKNEKKLIGEDEQEYDSPFTWSKFLFPKLKLTKTDYIVESSNGKQTTLSQIYERLALRKFGDC